ncbi:MAG: hypothetical protein LC687_07875, partial [Actinobacteria bacterium]|nr:hypothetical protein [Actinomycetota bacterium]
MRFSCNGTTWSSFEAYATPKTNFDIKPTSTTYGCGTGDGSRTVYVNFQDSLGNIGPAYNTGAFTLDTTAPTVGTPTIYSGTTYGSYFTGTISLRAAISDTGPSFLDGSSCVRSINGGGWSATGVTQDANYCYYNSYTPGASFDIRFRVADLSGNYGYSTTPAFTYDGTAPTISSVTENDTDNIVKDGTVVTITSDGADAGSGINTCYAYWDSNTSYAGTETSIVNLGTDCDGNVTTPNSTDGTWYYCVRPVDNVGLSNYSCTNAMTYDETAPTVTINQASGQSDPTNTSPINYTVVFSESVTGFATGDVTLSGTAGATTGTVTGSGTTYNVAVSGMTGSGTVIATIASSKATDAAGNNNAASTSTDNTVTYDITAPTGGSFTINSGATYTTSQTGNTLNVTCPT